MNQEDEEYIVEEILDHTKNDKGVKYYIKWEGYDSSFNTWEYEENLDCPELLEKYLSKLETESKAQKKIKHNSSRTRSGSIKTSGIQVEEHKKIPVILNYPTKKAEMEWVSWEAEVERILSIKKYSTKHSTNTYVIVAWKSGIFSAIEISKAHEKLQNHMLDFYYSNLKFY